MVNIPYAKHEIKSEDIQAVTRALQSTALTGGSELQSFENEFSSYVNAPYAVGVSSGTAALHLAVTALGLKRTETVIVPSLTFAASANAVLYQGSKVEFVDIDPSSLLLDIETVEHKLTQNPGKYAGVIGVDFAGYPLDSKRLAEVCHDNNAWLIEDAAHALGAQFQGEDATHLVGDSEYDDITTFSFHPAKHITTGEGGMATTKDPILAAKLRNLRSHGMIRDARFFEDEPWKYALDELGYNYRMSEIAAALGRSQLGRLEDNIFRRKTIARQYDEALYDEADIRTPDYNPAHQHANHLYTIQVPNRLKIYNHLKNKGIFSQIHYVPLHTQPLYHEFKGNSRLVHTEQYYDHCLSLPLYPALTNSEQEYVIDSLIQAIKQR